MHNARERLGEHAQRDDGENLWPGEGENAHAEVPRLGEAEGNPGVTTVTIAEPVVTNAQEHRDSQDDGQMHD
jgi:hypothetical protein